MTGISHVGVQLQTVQWKNQQVPIAMFGIAQALKPDLLERPQWRGRRRAASLAVATPDVAVTSKTKPSAQAFKARFGTPPAYTGYTAYDEVYIITRRSSAQARSRQDGRGDGEDQFEGTIGNIEFYGKDDEFTHGIKSGPGYVSGLVFQWQNGGAVVVWPAKIADGKLQYPRSSSSFPR